MSVRLSLHLSVSKALMLLYLRLHFNHILNISRLTPSRYEIQRNCSMGFYTQMICAAEGSTVTIGCSYWHPANIKVKYEMWFYDYNKNSTHNTRENNIYHTNDHIELIRYRNRVQFSGNKNKMCSVRISDVRREESRYYKFRFEGDGYGQQWTGVPGVSVTVTGEIRDVCLCLICWITTSGSWISNTSPVFVRSLNVSQSPKCLFIGLDHGSYWCQTEVTTSPAYQLNVMYAPKNVVISGPHTICVEEGTSMTLYCTAIANPPGTYTWVKDNISIPGSGEHLQFTRADLSAAGSYQCEVTNIYGATKSAAVTLDKLRGFSPTTCAQERKSVTLNCKASANPASSYTWVKENTGRVGAGEHLHISAFNVNDAGSYHCEATNIHGRAKSAVVKLTVNDINTDTQDNTSTEYQHLSLFRC
uniref:B-cell receptor CD22 n=1 Tax=Erpetoichthys calabaricus TaxID=27687 RepID=A0A8C4SVR5_ERPCA